MAKSMSTSDSQVFQKNMMAAFIQIAALVILVSYCLIIIGPFAGLAIWGIVLAVALYPLHLKLAAMLGERHKLTATLVIVVGLFVVLVPGWIVTKSALLSMMSFSTELKSGSISVPPPSEAVASWPLIGEQLYASWVGAAGNLEATMNEFAPQLRQVGSWVALKGVLAGIGLFAMGVPHAGLLAAVVLVTSIIQIPALLIILPIVVWVFSYAEPLPATIFAIYMLFAALSDNVLKPILLGRGVDLPAIIVLFGALGGMIAFGVIGLFLGAIILGLGYTIISDWLRASDNASVESADAS
jgi:predicted PurR-regulated permease PerM